MPSTMPKKNWYKPMTLVTRLTVTASSSNDWKPSFSSIVATGSRPPYGVRFLPRKSYSVDALILLGSGITSRTPCLAGFRRVCCFLWFTIWVAPENRSAKLELRAPTVLTQDSQGLQMDALPATSFAPQFRRIIQVTGNIGIGNTVLVTGSHIAPPPGFSWQNPPILIYPNASGAGYTTQFDAAVYAPSGKAY